jgi:hypothetical protein
MTHPSAPADSAAPKPGDVKQDRIAPDEKMAENFHIIYTVRDENYDSETSAGMVQPLPYQAGYECNPAPGASQREHTRDRPEAS